LWLYKGAAFVAVAGGALAGIKMNVINIMTELNKENIWWVLIIVSELILGITIGLIFIKTTLYCSGLLGTTYFSGIFRFYGSLSLVFFITVFIIGIYCARKMGKSRLIKRAILFSIGMWILSLIIYTMTFKFFTYELNLRILPNFIILLGVVIGFNIGLLSTTTKN